jgi:hypothetical protein
MQGCHYEQSCITDHKVNSNDSNNTAENTKNHS